MTMRYPAISELPSTVATRISQIRSNVGGGTVIRPQAETAIAATDGLLLRLKRRQIFRVGFLAATLLALAELGGAFPLFFRIIKIEGLGAKVPAGNKADILASFQATNDEPILNQQGRFFLTHGPGAIVAAYRKCVHLGCTVPWNKAEDQFHCPCHGSLYEKRTALMTRNPAPHGLDLFHITEVNGVLVVDTNPLNVMKRLDNKWHPEHVEIADS
jgi:cytochrome b6-f complex iron-sulfur subunit